MEFTLFDFVMSVFGMMLALILDRFWFQKGIQKYEKGLELFEHYHFGLIVTAIGIGLGQPILIGIGSTLVWKESEQDHPFAMYSGHFKSSSAVGLITAGILAGVGVITFGL